MLPFLLEYRTAVKMVETGAIVSTVSQIRNLEEVAPARPAVRMIEGDADTQARELLRLLHEEAKVI